MRPARLRSLLLTGLLIITYSFGLSAASTPPPAFVATPIPGSDVEAAFLAAANSRTKSLYAIPLFQVEVENIYFSADKAWAFAWLALANPMSGEVLPSEPTPSLAYWDGQTWTAVLPNDPAWEKILAQAPDSVFPDEARNTWLMMNSVGAQELAQAALSGYFLPWEAGKTVYLSRSVAHDGDFPSGSAHYSFDFYVPQTMFNIHASKAGTVWLYKDTVPNNDHSDVNYLVLQDTTTNPVTYQLYLHLAQNSIPPALKSIGAPVAQGQWIGIADNTGQSTGHHLHFQVETQPSWLYWGTSVDITFNEVDINGGRPRVSIDFPYCTRPGDVCITARSAYVSANVPPGSGNPPFGDLTSPENGSLVQSSALTISGWAADTDGAVVQTRLIAEYGSGWKPIGPVFTNTSFTYNWDMCADQVPDGPVSLALQILDSSGKWAPGLPGLHHVIKRYTCPPPPTCIPSSNQIALFAEANYQGTCALFSTGSYTSPTSFGALGTANAASIKVGANVMATLYLNNNLSGRGETFASQDSNLSDNIIGADTVSSLKVTTKGSPPITPLPIWPLDGASFASNTSHSLSWDDGGWAGQFQVELDGTLSAWQKLPFLHLGSLPSGSHTWRVRARNDYGTSAWSPYRSFTVAAPPALPTPLTPPYSDTMENGYNGWSNTSNWDQSLDFNHTPGGSVSWKYEVNDASIGYDNGKPNSGDLTSPPIFIPSNGYYLRFWYLYETESAGLNWDQRWVQLSVNGGAFQNILQLADDPPNYWLQSPVIDLSPYSGASIQIRFHFETLDAAFNTRRGWFIDDFTIDQSPPPLCSPNGEPDNLASQARSLSQNSSLTGEICPGGDVDYFRFVAPASARVGIAASAQSQGSPLDTYLFLLDSDGVSLLSSNDDQIPYDHTDSYLSYDLTPGQTYYLKLRAWDHPSAGSPDHTYTLSLFGSDAADPSAAFIFPQSGIFLPNSPFNLELTAADAQSGVSHVDFFWHSGDWLFSNWVSLGSDWDVSDGWSYSFDTTSLPDQKDIAFWARAYDWVGNFSDVALWNLAIDRTPPVTAIQSIPSTQTSTVIRVPWTGSDNLAGIAYFDLQQKTDSGNWQDWLSGVSGEKRQAWFVGQMGHSYSFRMRGVDRLGNAEAYPSTAEASTSIPTSVCSAGDTWENDNTPGSARQISSSAIQTHNFCNPASGSGWLNDQDWFKIDLKTGYRLSIQLQPQNSGASGILQLYAVDGTSLLTQATPTDLGEDTRLVWNAIQDELVYLKVSPMVGGISGDGATYQIAFQLGYPTYLPDISR